jgi:hypothetical protein
MYESYQGKGGVELNTFWKRILYAVKFGSKEILLSDNIDKNSRIMYKRRIMERIQTVAPFFNYDNDPYMVIANGKLYWMVDAYTSNSLYPYAEPINFQGRRINYIRNSVKIIVNAYNGDITFYKTTDKDPIINVIDKIYPDLLTDMDKMPEALRAHIRYPQGIFDLQTEIFRTYHMQNVQNFYNKEDQWEIPVISDVNTKEQGSSIAPRHLVMKLPDEKKAEYILMLPYTPRGKNNLAAWLAARNDGKNYGEMVVYRFPKDSLVYGPAQITSRINQDADISQQISLWDQRGSQAIQGPLLVIPIEQSLLYVRPLYLQAESGKIPELKRVIVAYKDKIKMAETFETALGKIFGDITEAENKNDAKQQSKPSQSDQSITKTTEDTKQEDLSADEQEIIEKAKKYYEAAIEAQRNGNWKEYGENIKKLGDLLE